MALAREGEGSRVFLLAVQALVSLLPHACPLPPQQVPNSSGAVGSGKCQKNLNSQQQTWNTGTQILVPGGLSTHLLLQHCRCRLRRGAKVVRPSALVPGVLALGCNMHRWTGLFCKQAGWGHLGLSRVPAIFFSSFGGRGEASNHRNKGLK